MNDTYDLDELREEFLQILGTQSEIKSQTIREQKKINFNSSMEVKTLRKQNYELKKTLFNAKMDVKTKNESVEFLTKENETLHKFVYKQRNELAKQTKTEKELESKLKQKEKEICDLKKKMESILVVTESIVIKTEIELSNFSKFQNEKLIRK
jgi:hypothetical protein